MIDIEKAYNEFLFLNEQLAVEITDCAINNFLP